MELIFDSVEERDDFIQHVCPASAGGKNIEECRPFSCGWCKKCWEQSGVKYHIKGESSGALRRTLMVMSAYDDMKPGDKLCKTEDAFYVQRKQEEPKEKLVIRTSRNPYANDLVRSMLNSVYGADGPIKHFDTDKASTFSVLSKLDYQFYNNTNWKEALEVFMDKHDRIKKPVIKDVIFHDPATIVFWVDGTKTVVKVREGDRFDPEKGLAMAICKKVLGNKDGEYWTEHFKKWLPEPKTLGESLKELSRKLAGLRFSFRHDASIPPLGKVSDVTVTHDGVGFKVEPPKKCEDCKYADVDVNAEPCLSCDEVVDCGNFEPKGEEKKEVEKRCSNCEYKEKDSSEEPCRDCHPITRDKFEEGTVARTCYNCKNGFLSVMEEPCKSCDCNTKSNFDAKAEKKIDSLSCQNCEHIKDMNNPNRPCPHCLEIDFKNWRVIHHHYKSKDAK